MHLGAHVPNWIKQDVSTLGRPLSVVEAKFLNDPALGWVWESIGRAKHLEDGDVFASSRLTHLLNAVNHGNRKLTAWDARGTPERQQTARRVAALVSELTTELAPLVADPADTHATRPPSSSYFALADYAEEMARSFVLAIRLFDEGNPNARAPFVRTLDERQKLDLESVIRECFWFAASRATTMLPCFVEAASYAASCKPEVYRPREANAQRLIFIRRLTRMFLSQFGRPFREETLAIAGHFYDTSDLDAASLSRLAPVGKVRDR